MSESLSWPDWALHNSNGTIHRVSTILEQAVKVDAGGLIAELIDEMYCNLLANVDIQDWCRPLPIDANDWP